MKTTPTAPAVTSAPSLSTPRAQEPRSVDRSGDSETSSSDIEANALKHKKTKCKDRSARGLEFQRKEVIGRAYIHYKLRIMTQEPWTRLDIQAVEAWGDACDDLGVGFDLAPRAQEQELVSSLHVCNYYQSCCTRLGNAHPKCVEQPRPLRVSSCLGNMVSRTVNRRKSRPTIATSLPSCSSGGHSHTLLVCW